MFTPTRPLLKSAGSSSSRAWLARQFRDPYVKQRMQFPSAYRSRAAFKLIQIDDQFRLFDKAVWGPKRGVRGLKAVEKRLRKERMGNSTETERMSGGSESLPQARAVETDNEAGSSTIPATTASAEQYSRRIVVIDLGAAPGGWSQVVASKLGIRPQGGGFAADAPPYIDSKGKGRAEETQADDPEDTWSVPSSSRSPESLSPYFRIDPTIIAVDILPMSPIRGVKTIRQDFLSPDADSIISVLLPPDRPKADVILSDIAVNISGNKDKDEMSVTDVLYAVYRFAKKYLRKKEGISSGGWLVCVHSFPNRSLSQIHILFWFQSQILRLPFCLRVSDENSAAFFLTSLHLQAPRKSKRVARGVLCVQRVSWRHLS